MWVVNPRATTIAPCIRVESENREEKGKGRKRGGGAENGGGAEGGGRWETAEL